MTSIKVNFAVADDLLREAVQGRLAQHDVIVLERSGRIGPLVETALASILHGDQYRGVSINSPFANSLNDALQSGRPFGGSYSDRVGAFPLTVMNPVTAPGADWDQWTTHAENAAKAQGFNSHFVAGLLGALIEIQDNVYEHSGAPETGVVAYATTPNSFEFVVADRGMGVLSSLRHSPKYADVGDAGAALQLAITDGVSRFPSETGHGQGFNQLFRTLVGHNAELRFRSGDHALTLRPGRNITEGASVLAQVAPMAGLSISVFCNGGGALP